MIPILCTVDPFFENMYDAFLVSTYKKYQLDKFFTLKCNEIPQYHSPPYGFCTISYGVYRQTHLQYLLTHLEQNSDEYIISVDSDMLFLKGFVSQVSELIDFYPEKNLFITRDSDQDIWVPNFGLMILKNTKPAKDFLKESILHMGKIDTNCSGFYNILGNHLKKNHKTYDYLLLDVDRFIHNNSPIETIKHRLYSQYACSFHATSASNIYAKSYVLSNVMNFLDLLESNQKNV